MCYNWQTNAPNGLIKSICIIKQFYEFKYTENRLIKINNLMQAQLHLFAVLLVGGDGGWIKTKFSKQRTSKVAKFLFM